ICLCVTSCAKNGDASEAAGSSHMTTPEKSLLDCTAGSRESLRATLPLTVAPGASELPKRRLKLISQRKIIVVVQPGSDIDVGGANLHNLQPQDYVGRHL